jgi:hypothetical protein
MRSSIACSPGNIVFRYPQEFAEDIFARIEQALRRRISDNEANARVQTVRLFLEADSTASEIPDLPAHYVLSSDKQTDQKRLLHGRLEGEFLVSYETAGGWVAITKDTLSEVLGAGHDVKIVGLPDAVVRVLRLMCARL